MPDDEGARTLQHSRPPPPTMATPTFRLRVERGPDAGLEIHIDGTHMFLERAATSGARAAVHRRNAA